MNLYFYAALPEIRRVTDKDREELCRLSWNPQELIQLKLMSRHQLLGLMMFCGIHVVNDIPVLACEDDELRTAYLIWRGALSKEKRWRVLEKANQLKKVTEMTYEGLIWWMENLW